VPVVEEAAPPLLPPTALAEAPAADELPSSSAKVAVVRRRVEPSASHAMASQAVVVRENATLRDMAAL
jgi:hypothetical protein